MSAREPRWLLRDVLLAMHEQMLAEHGGQEGVRDPGLLESALDRPRNQFHYGGQQDLFALAAAYAFAIANNHPFLDGNKRAAFMAAYVFLADNGWELMADEAAAVVMTVGLADKSVSEEAYAKWLGEKSVEFSG